MTKQIEAVAEFASDLVKNFESNLSERTDDFRNGDGFETSVNSVLSALLGRQAALALGMAESPPTWTGHISPLILRSMIDLLITFRWILIEPRERSQEYINYGLGTEKLITANYQEKLEDGHENLDVARIIEANLAWIESQKFQMFVPVNFGSWTGVSVRKMCDEIGDPDLYKFSYVPFSSCVHNMWNHVGKWNAITCENPLHKQHMIGTVKEMWPIVDFVFRASKYYELVLNEFDNYYDFRSSAQRPTEAFTVGVEKLSAAWNSD